MAKTITIDPLTRIEGHLAVHVETENGRIAQAFCSGEMYRGFETILRGRHPLDAQQIVQRICGVCPISHGTASVFAQEMAYTLAPPNNGRLLRNLILGANYIQSHILHFYHLSALDFIDVTAVTAYTGADPALNDLKAWIASEVSAQSLYPGAPFLPRYDAKTIANADFNLSAAKHYLEAFEIRALAHETAAIFGGKIPHSPTLVPGGCTEHVTASNAAAYRANIKRILRFINECYLPDVLAVAAAFPEYAAIGKGCGNYLAYGAFPESAEPGKTFLPSGVLRGGVLTDLNVDHFAEDVSHSKYSSPSGLKPESGQTTPSPTKPSAYSWLKAPRYQRAPMEVGPLARVMVARARNHARATSALDAVLAKAKLSPAQLDSVLGRHVARAVECSLVAERCLEWINDVAPGQPTCAELFVPKDGHGRGLVEAPRGALGHWLTFSNREITNYQCIVPTTWNCSPRDDSGVPGPIEQALAGTPVANEENPIEAAVVVRSFDPCIACAVH